MSAPTKYAKQIINSALWSAYGDALGFITELRDNERAIFTRIGSDRVTHTLPWKRRVGGKFGAEATLRAGCYSDDTQLRLATARGIRPDGSFNIEGFAKMELPVWTSYALGAGRGTKAAATNLARDGVNWFSNFYESEATTYFQSGGNGAAMRIQPHVWSAKQAANFQQLVAPIVRNAVSTHGHARAIVGAVFHALCLDYARKAGASPKSGVWKDMIEECGKLADTIEMDADLKTFWLPVWEQKSGTTFRAACASVQKELLQDIEILISGTSAKTRDETYHNAAQRIGGLDERTRGSSTKTALLSAFLAELFSEEGPDRALVCAANCLSSDTDTIATMAGAIMGFTSNEAPSGELMDKSYITGQAERLARISVGESVEQFNYPNLLQWKPPKTQQESVVIGDRGLEVLVLGKVAAEGQIFETRKNEPILWQWLELELGQAILAKRRKTPPRMNTYQRPFVPSQPSAPIAVEKINQTQLPLASVTATRQSLPKLSTIDALSKQAIQSHFDPRLIGEHLLMLSSSPDGIERAVAYAAIIAKARLARNKQSP